MTSRPRPIVILGPTGSGKSGLAAALAARLAPAAVVGADSMQVYKHLDAGTAKPGPAERAAADHYLIDAVAPTERFTVADYLAAADARIESLRNAGTRPIVVGGTHLYLKALLEGLGPAPPGDAGLRARLETLATPELRRRLEAADPTAAERIHRNDRKRAIRALEVHELTGEPLSAHQREWAEAPARDNEQRSPSYRHAPVLVGIARDRAELHGRINARVKRMFHPPEGGESLPEEVRRLEAAGLLGPQAREALGYKQVLAALHGDGRLDDAREATKVQTRRFARQQRSWGKRFRGTRWLDATGRDGSALAAEAAAVIESAEAGDPITRSGGL